MTQNRVDTEQNQIESADQTVVGVVAREGTTDEVMRTILRAKNHGYHVVLTHPGDREIEPVRLAEQLDVEIVDPPKSMTDHESLVNLLVLSARARKFPGIIVQSGDFERIDYESSESKLDDDTFATEAVSELEPEFPSNPNVLVGIPAYNEAETIGDVVTEAQRYADGVVVVDDGSSDETCQRAAAAGATVIEHRTNRGYGAALKTIFENAEECGAEHLVVMDGDGQHDPSDIRRMVRTQAETDADIVIGNRFMSDSETTLPLYRWFGLKAINAMTNVSLANVSPSTWISDTQSGFRAYNRRTVELLADEVEIGDQMDASTDIIYSAVQRDYRIEEMDTKINYDVDNANSHNPVYHGMMLVGNLLQTIEREHPILLLGVPGFAAVLVGLGFGYWALVEFLQSGTLSLGLGLTASFITLFGLFLAFTAIILHSVNSHLKSASVTTK